MRCLFFITAISICFTSQPLAEPEVADSLQKNVLSAGGMEILSTNYQLLFTVGQSGASQSSSGGFDGSWGYWTSGTLSSGDCQGSCGDANSDGGVNVSDAVWIINYVFVSGSPEPLPVRACGDANADGGVNVSDAVWVINFVFVSGSPPPGTCAPGAPNWAGQDCCPY